MRSARSAPNPVTKCLQFTAGYLGLWLPRVPLDEGLTVADVFDRIPPYEIVRGWLGTEAVERLLRFAESNEHRFVDTEVTHGKGDRVDHTRRMSRKLSLGYLKDEVRSR